MFRRHLLYFKISAEIPRLLWGSKSNRSAFWHVTSLVFRRHLIFPPSKWRLDEPPAGEILKPDIINFQTPSCFFFKMASERTPLLAGPDYSHPMENLDIDRLFEERLGEFGRCATLVLRRAGQWARDNCLASRQRQRDNMLVLQWQEKIRKQLRPRCLNRDAPTHYAVINLFWPAHFFKLSWQCCRVPSSDPMSDTCSRKLLIWAWIIFLPYRKSFDRIRP